MKRLFNSGEGATALLNNIAYTTGVSGDHWLSGLQVTPNTTDTSGIYVDVANGVVNVNDTEVNIASQKVQLSAASNDPYIAVIYADSNGMGAIEGAEAARDPSGASFPNLWSPAPDDGGNVPGVARATVIVDPSVADSTDLTSGDIRNYNAQGVEAVTTDSLPTDIGNIPDGDLPLQTEAQSAATFGGEAPNTWRTDYQSITLPSASGSLYSNGNGPPFYQVLIPAPASHRLAIHRVTLIARGNSVPPGVTARVSRQNPDTGDLYTTSQRFNENSDGSPLATSAGTANPQLFQFIVEIADSTDTSTDPLNATFRYELFEK